MKKIEAKIIADSIGPNKQRITSMILTYPRFIHSELMTHRMFSRNSASSRAIPFEKMVKMVQKDPCIPIAWQKDHKGMQGTEYITNLDARVCEREWIDASKFAVQQAKKLQGSKWLSEGTSVTKQLCNRLLEPFMWHTVLVTATEWDNFFELRCPFYRVLGAKNDPFNLRFDHRSKKDLEEAYGAPDVVVAARKKGENEYFAWQSLNLSQAEIHIQALAEAMWDAINESTPKELQGGEWHIPFGDNIDENLLNSYDDFDNQKIKISTARCARLSYMTFEGKIDYEKDIALHDQLLTNGHMSPFEHCARVMSDEEYYSFVRGEFPTTKDEWGIVNYERYPYIFKAMFGDEPIGINPNNPDIYGWCDNFRGFISYRHLIEKKL